MTRTGTRLRMDRSRRRLSALLRRLDRPPLETAATHWSARDEAALAGAHWWQHPQILRHINGVICGVEVEGVNGGDVMLLANRRLKVGVSVGCGAASKEMAVLASGAVEHFHLYEIADKRIERGKAAAARRGLTERMTWHRELVDFDAPLDVELVYWNNALHHMLDSRRAVAWSRASLRPGGVFLMNDFVGPDRMQWTDEMLRVATVVRSILPDRLIGAAGPEVRRPDPHAMARRDPTECADSAAILPAVKRHFPGAQITLTGGVIYHVALQGVLERLTDDDHDLLDWLLQADDLCRKRGLTNYAVAMGEV